MHFVAWRDPANDDTGEGFGILHKMDKTNKQQTEKKKLLTNVWGRKFSD